MLTASTHTINKNLQGNLFTQGNSMQQKKQINFGYAPKPLLQKSKGFFINYLDNVLKNEKGVGQLASNVINYAGKAILEPAMILVGSTFTHEDKDNVKSNMMIPPVLAGITLGLSSMFGFIANNFIGTAAKTGKLGEFFTREANIKELKSHSHLAMTFLAIPVAAKLLNWALPKLKGYDAEDYKEKPIPETIYSNLYATRLSDRDNMKVFAESLKPNFGNLTGGTRKHG